MPNRRCTAHLNLRVDGIGLGAGTIIHAADFRETMTPGAVAELTAEGQQAAPRRARLRWARGAFSRPVPRVIAATRGA